MSVLITSICKNKGNWMVQENYFTVKSQLLTDLASLSRDSFMRGGWLPVQWETKTFILVIKKIATTMTTLLCYWIIQSQLDDIIFHSPRARQHQSKGKKSKRPWIFKLYLKLLSVSRFPCYKLTRNSGHIWGKVWGPLKQCSEALESPAFDSQPPNNSWMRGQKF